MGEEKRQGGLDKVCAICGENYYVCFYVLVMYYISIVCPVLPTLRATNQHQNPTKRGHFSPL